MRHPLLACARALSTLVVIAVSLLASGCIKAPPNQPDAQLAIGANALIGPYQPGDNIAFRVMVTNLGNRDASNVGITSTLGANVHERSVICSPLGLSAAHAGDAECADRSTWRPWPRGRR